MASEIMALLKSDNQKTEEEEFLKQEEVDTKRNKIDLMKLNSVIERLENPLKPTKCDATSYQGETWC